MHQDEPGEFFEVRYPIPFDLIEGETDALGQKVESVTVKFQAHPGAIAGGVFGLRVVERGGTDGERHEDALEDIASLSAPHRRRRVTRPT